MALGAQAGHEAQPVEIAAGQLAVAQADRVDGADQARGRRDLVAQDGGLFLWGTVTTSPPRLCKPRRPANSAGRPSGETWKGTMTPSAPRSRSRALSRCGV